MQKSRIQKQKQIVENKNTKCLMQGQKNNSRKQKTYKENHNAQSRAKTLSTLTTHNQRGIKYNNTKHKNTKCKY